MYLERDLLLNQICECDCEDDLYKLMTSVFPGTEYAVSVCNLPGGGSRLSSLICTLVYVTGFCTVSELSQLVSPFFSSAAVRMCISRLVKKGDLHSYTMPCHDFNARSFLSLTQRGYDGLSLSEPLKPRTESGRPVLRRKVDVKFPKHDYGVGVSLLSLISCGCPIAFAKEDKTYPNLITDCTCTMYPEGRAFYTMYIEQDMFTEGLQYVYAKLEKYAVANMLDLTHFVVFSFHQTEKNDSVLGDAYSPSKVRRIALCMSEHGCDSLWKYYKTFAQGDGTDSACRDLIGKVGKYFSIDDVNRYADELDGKCNPYRIREYNRRQYGMAKGAVYYFWSRAYEKKIRAGDTASGEIVNCFDGLSCYALPSVLLGKSTSLMDPGNHSYGESCLFVVRNFYPSAESNTQQVLSPPFYYNKYMPLRFRRCFDAGSGHLICFEHIGRDLCGYARLSLAVKAYQSDPDSFLGNCSALHLIAVCDDFTDIEKFFGLVGFSSPCLFDDTSRFTLYFILQESVECIGERVLYCYEDGAVRGVMLTSEQEERHRHIIFEHIRSNR